MAFARDADDESRSVEASGTWRAARGVLSGEVRETHHLGGGRETIAKRVGLEGSLACVGTHCELAQPVIDSFAVVDLAGVPDVRVYRNNQEIGKTNSRGSSSSRTCRRSPKTRSASTTATCPSA
jgi:outer membrane usher protein FimD/PapC